MDDGWDVCRPLRAGLFFYECLRLFLLVIFIFVASMGSGFSPKGFPYLVYFCSNALFPLMALFVWLKPEEYHNYLNLYMAGKIIIVVTFYLWQFFSSRESFGTEFSGTENPVIIMFFLFGSVIISIADIFSLWGAWTLKNKFRRVISLPPDTVNGSEDGGL